MLPSCSIVVSVQTPAPGSGPDASLHPCTAQLEPQALAPADATGSRRARLLTSASAPAHARLDLTSVVAAALSATATRVREVLLVSAEAIPGLTVRGGRPPDEPTNGDATTVAAVTGTAPAVYGSGLVRVVPCSPQSGVAAAANVGAAEALGDYVLFLHPAMQPQIEAVDALVRSAERTPAGVAFGGKVLAAEDTIQQAGMVFDHEGAPRRLYAGFPAGHPAANRARRLQILSAACLLVRRDIFVAMGGFDAGLAAEDAACDFCLRLGERGFEVHYVPESVVRCTAADQEAEAFLARSRRTLRTRWVHKITPDDVACYQQDGLLRLQYEDGMPVRAIVAPPFETGAPAAAACASERMLSARARQVQTLLAENARLADRVALLEAAELAATEQALLPPPELELSVGGRFREVGDEFLAYFVDIGGLRPTDRVLDVGCGVGRMAVPLTRYLTDPGSYDGFDVMPRAIAWCQTHITPRFPRFRFQYIPLRNDSYNTTATQTAAAFQFPYPAARFDFVLLTSVFTHLLPDAAQHYLSQIAAVLKPGGRCFSTFFLLNAESEGLLQAGLSPHFPFAHRYDDHCRVQDAKTPEAAIAYDEAHLRAWFEAAGLTIADPIRYGSWCGRLDGLSLQDIIVAAKK